MALPACVVGIHGSAITSSRPGWVSSDLWLRVEDDQHRKAMCQSQRCLYALPSLLRLQGQHETAGAVTSAAVQNH
jgi:hypothetical protein